MRYYVTENGDWEPVKYMYTVVSAVLVAWWHERCSTLVYLTHWHSYITLAHRSHMSITRCSSLETPPASGLRHHTARRHH